MNKEFVPYQPSVDLKELGFNMKTFAQYSTKIGDEWIISFNAYGEGQFTGNEGPCIAPTFSQAFRWFREKYNLHAEPYTADMGAIEYCFQIRDLYSEKYVYDNFKGAGSSYMGTFNTHEEAELAAIAKLIEIVKNK